MCTLLHVHRQTDGRTNGLTDGGMLFAQVYTYIGQLAGQEIRQQGDQPILGGVNHMTAQIVEWTIGEGRARTETVIRDKVNHIVMTIEMTIDVNKGGVPIDR